MKKSSAGHIAIAGTESIGRSAARHLPREMKETGTTVPEAHTMEIAPDLPFQ